MFYAPGTSLEHQAEISKSFHPHHRAGTPPTPQGGYRAGHKTLNVDTLKSHILMLNTRTLVKGTLISSDQCSRENLSTAQKVTSDFFQAEPQLFRRRFRVRDGLRKRTAALQVAEVLRHGGVSRQGAEEQAAVGRRGNGQVFDDSNFITGTGAASDRFLP